MKDGAPFGIAGIWENWKEPASGEWIRTFAIITTDSNELVDRANTGDLNGPLMSSIVSKGRIH
jgi:hypothetical protein